MPPFICLDGTSPKDDGRRRKAGFLSSRVESTALLARTVARLKNPPKVLIVASAIGIYGDRGDEPLTEDAPIGQGYLPDLCRQWEAASDCANDAGIRVVHVRIGIVLHSRGGALAKLVTPFKLGMGGPHRFGSAIHELHLIG